MNLKNVNWEVYDISKMKLIHYNTSNKEDQPPQRTNQIVIKNRLYSHSDVHYLSNKFVYVTTPVMVAPFGFNKDTHLLYLQFTKLNTDAVMKSFYDFINTMELSLMKHIGITEHTLDLYLSQIKQDKNKKYDPNLVTKVPWRAQQNRYDVNIVNKDNIHCSLFNIPNFAKLQCDIYIDKLWKYNDNYVCKWKVKNIYLL